MAAPTCLPIQYFRVAATSRARHALTATLLVVTVAGCSRENPVVEDVRPVRAMRIQAADTDSTVEYAGEVRARVESRLGFRVGGKIVERKVDAGTAVKQGQILMRLDPRDLQLAQAQANAGLTAAQTNLDLARNEFKRYQELWQKNFVSQAVLDGKEAAYKAAQANYDQALASYRNQSNQAAYAALVADMEGVVTAVDAEVGQVVAPGTPVVRVAGAGGKEVVVGIPEDKVSDLGKVDQIKVRTWALPHRWFPGRLREVSPAADPVTRTYTARISLPDAPSDIRLGMTAYAAFVTKSQHPIVKLPLSALFKNGTGSAVWVVEQDRVNAVQVQVAGVSGNDVLVSSGLVAGQAVVTAGVNLLQAGQKVNILDDALQDATQRAQNQVSAATGMVR